METIAYLMFGTLALAALAFALSLAARLSSMTGGKAHTAHWATIFGGAGFVLFGCCGLMSLSYLEGVLPKLLSVLFVLWGAFQLHVGLKARRAVAKP